MPASARLATVATVTGEERRGGVGGLLLARFELGDARFQLSELRLRALEQLLLHVEVLAQHEIQAVEPGGEQRLQISLDVLRRRAAQRLVDAGAQVIEEALVDHAGKVASRARTRSAHHPPASAPQKCIDALSLSQLFN